MQAMCGVGDIRIQNILQPLLQITPYGGRGWLLRASRLVTTVSHSGLVVELDLSLWSDQTEAWPGELGESETCVDDHTT